MTTPLELDEFQELLTCSLCSGFYRDAHTILECMHTFCKSCVLKHFHNNNQRGSITCPQCNTALGLYGHLSSKMIYDRDLQSIVDKIFPQFLALEKVAEEKYYADRSIPLKSSSTSKKHSLKEEMTSPPSKRTKTEAPPTVEVPPAEASSPPISMVEFTVKLVPALAVDKAFALPGLAKRLCKATKAVRIAKLKSFVFKRLPEEDQKDMTFEDIVLTYKGQELMSDWKLQTLSDAIDKSIDDFWPIEIDYRRAIPRAV